MAFSMHSHSGQFCPGHAKDTLEQVIQTAISRGMQTFALTEHMPRNSNSDLYPEEVEAGDDVSILIPRHEAYLMEAIRLRKKYQNELNILIGFEGEWIRSDYGPLIQHLASNPTIDFFIGSIHHVNEVPIDYDAAWYAKAVEKSGGSEEKLYADYYEQQYEMLCALKPKVVGHFDLIRLLSEKPDRHLKEWKRIWGMVLRNLGEVVRYGGLLEINTSALRKGLKEPYPGRQICEAYINLGGKFTMSDDSHGIGHVGTNFVRAIEYLESLGIKEVFTFERNNTADSNETVKSLSLKSVPLSSVKETFIPG
ncbi:putative histidinol-phosphatase [Sclerotinia borealis F-4128]|uniref:Histidinol-phosphatase n=1 Tax=Sclerotinia borealis (strain F-4128) TaxID=1432307 RepID=W9CNS7_SCLBF|nr:putative histidinol-phosphatase [Sclerotinia borealis F-4128]